MSPDISSVVMDDPLDNGQGTTAATQVPAPGGEDRLISSYIDEILHEQQFLQRYSMHPDDTPTFAQPKRAKKVRKMVNVDGRLVRSDRAKQLPCTHEGCKKTFSSTSCLKRHMKSHNKQQNRQFACTVPGCTKSFLHRHHLTRHMKVHNEAPFVCKECNVSYRRHAQLIRHQTDQHNMPAPFACTVAGCGRTFVSASLLTKHAKKHVNSVFCQLCKVSFATNSDYTQHCRTDHVTCACDLCGREFPTRAKLEHHKQMFHTTTGAVLQCTIDACTQVFLSEDALRVHTQNAHGEQLPFACDVEGCTSRFQLKTSLRKHRRQKHGLKSKVPHGDPADLVSTADWTDLDDLDLHGDMLTTELPPPPVPLHASTSSPTVTTSLEAYQNNTAHEPPLSLPQTLATASFPPSQLQTTSTSRPSVAGDELVSMHNGDLAPAFPLWQAADQPLSAHVSGPMTTASDSVLTTAMLASHTSQASLTSTQPLQPPFVPGSAIALPQTVEQQQLLPTAPIDLVEAAIASIRSSANYVTCDD
eukprot:TRINITY_DN12457_c0_g2_i2.p1 TRINITY_DN12457_c0_g2~~TRINITY_DN12457_c0_g2_i2.p1  ORF type:complete len:529 (+),score=103.15 TRINITY_DN12457_c0_g2_i2:148-1734(+)